MWPFKEKNMKERWKDFEKDCNQLNEIFFAEDCHYSLMKRKTDPHYLYQLPGIRRRRKYYSGF